MRRRRDRTHDLVRRVRLPAGVDDVEAVYVDGVAAPGHEMRDGVLTLSEPVALARPMSLGGNLLTALCLGVYPSGRTVDLVVRRGGRRETLRVVPV
jgi:hypothetical protein